MNKYIVIILVITVTVLSLFFLLQKNLSKQTDQTLGEKKEEATLTINEKSGQPMIIDKNKTYQAVLKTTEGDITLEFNTKDTPITSNNFISLAKKKFYDNTIFHRVIKGFMIQGGDPKGDGTGGPGYRFADEPFNGNYSRGTVAMANAGPNTNGSQFFIMHEDYDLPKNYVIFAHVIAGMDVVDKIADASVKANPQTGEDSAPVVPVKIISIQILEK